MFQTIEDLQRKFIDPLPLPDGRDARGLRWLELSRALEPVLGDDFSPTDGKQALLTKFAEKLEAERAAAAPAEDSLTKQRNARRRTESADPRKPMSSGRAGPIDTRTDSDGSITTGASARI